jgi:hypothetical protein
MQIFAARLAWAIDDTIAALRDMRVVHLSGEGNLSEKTHVAADIWATADENGINSRDVRAVLHMGDMEQVLVVHDGKTHDYKSFTKEVVVYDGKGISLNPWPGSKFFEILKKEGENVEVTYGKDPQTQRDSVYLTASNAKFVKSWRIQFDARTNLPARLTEWKNLHREGLPTFDFTRIVYDEPLPADFFEFRVPEGVKVVQGEKNHDPAGIRTDGLSRDEACRRVVAEYWQALIDSDWGKAHTLRAILSQDEYRDMYPGNRPIAVVEVGQPYDQPGCDTGPVVPCRIRFQNGDVSTVKLMVSFRDRDGQKSCVIGGIWGLP